MVYRVTYTTTSELYRQNSTLATFSSVKDVTTDNSRYQMDRLHKHKVI